MESKEAPPHPTSEASSGSIAPLTYSDSVSVEGASLIGKAVDANGNDDDKGAVSEDEGGYLSGYEEFEPDLNKPVPDEDVVAENPDGSESLVISEKVESLKVSEGVVSGDFNEGAEKFVEAEEELKLVDKDETESVVEEDSAVDVIKVEVSPSVHGVAVGGTEENGDVEDKPVEEEVTVVEPEISEVASRGDVEPTCEGDSAVDTIKVDVANVGGTAENGDVVDKISEEVMEPEKVEVDSRGDVKLSGDGDSIVDAIKVDVSPTAPGVAVVGGTDKNTDVVDKQMEEAAEPEKLNVDDRDDVRLAADVDSGADSIQVDVTGVPVVEGSEDNEVVVDKVAEEVIEPEKLEVDIHGDVDSVVEGSEDNEVVVDKLAEEAIEPEKLEVESVVEGSEDNEVVVDKSAEEVIEPEKLEVDTHDDVDSVVEGSEDNEVVMDKLAEEKLELETHGDVDSVVDAIKVDVASASPRVGVVGATDKNTDVVDKPMEEVVEPEKPDLDNRDDVDSGADSVQVEVASADVGESEDTEDVVDKLAVEPEKLDVDTLGDRDSIVEGTEENVDVVDKDEKIDEVELDVEEEVITEPASENTADVSEVDEDGVKKPEVETEAVENGIADELTEEEPKGITFDIQEIGELEEDEDDSMSEGDMIFGGSEAAKKFMEDLERESGEDSHTLTEHSRDIIDGQIVTDSEGETDDDGDGKELFDSAALAALLKAATGGDSGGPITITSQDGSRLFSVERPAGLGSSLQSLRPAPRTNLSRPSPFTTLTPPGESENMTDEERKKLDKLQEIRVKFLRLVHRLGLPSDESVAAQVLYRLSLLGGRQNTQNFNLESAKKTALELEAEGGNDLDFSVRILVLGKSGVGKSATINSLFGEEKAAINAFQTGTDSVKEVSGLINGVKVCVFDTPGLKSSVAEQRLNRSILKNLTKKKTPDVVLYVDRLDSQSRDLSDLPFLKTVTTVLGSSIWRNAIVTLTHSASAPPDGPTGNPLSYEVFVSQRSHVVQQSIGNAVGDLRMMSPSVMNPVALVENHISCRKNREGEKILPNGQIWRPQLLLLCYSMKILSEANELSKPQEPFDHRKLFGFRARSPPLPYMLSSMLQSRAHPKLPSENSADSDIDLDEFSDSESEEGEHEYDQLPPFTPLKKSQISALTKEQRNAYFEEFDYRVKLAQKKQWREELKRLKELKKRGGNKSNNNDYDFPDDPDSGAAPVAVPLPDMALPNTFDGDNPAYRYRFLEPTSQFLARPVLDTHGWDHDCGYDGVNLEHSLGILNRFPAAYSVQITKDKKDFSVSLDSSIAAKLGDNVSTMAGFDIQGMGKQLAYVFRGETKVKNLRRNKVTGGVSFTLLGDDVVPAVKVEDEVVLGRRCSLVGSFGGVKSRSEGAYGANFEVQRREVGYPIGQVQSTMSVSVIRWRGDLAVGVNVLHQLNLGRSSKVALRAGINNKMSGQVTVRTSSSEHLSIALAAAVPTVVSVCRRLFGSD